MNISTIWQIPANIWKSAIENMWGRKVNPTGFHMLWLFLCTYVEQFVVEDTMAINFALNNILSNISHCTTPASKSTSHHSDNTFSGEYFMYVICHNRSDEMALITKLMQFDNV